MILAPFSCLPGQHDPLILLLAVVVCLVATGTSTSLVRMARNRPAPQRINCLLASGLSAGAGIWATHFVAMLAYDPGFGTAYEPIGTAASFLISIAFALATVLLVTKLRGVWSLAIGSGLFSLGVGAMHYTGMAALRLPGVLSWRPSYVILSFVLAAALAALAQWALVQHSTYRSRAGAAVLMGAAICALHFTGMAAVIITPDPTVFVPASVLPHPVMAAIVGGLTSLILLGSLAMMMFEARATKNSLDLLQSVVAVIPQGLAYFDHNDRLVLSNEHYRQRLASLGLKAKVGMTYREILEGAVSHESTRLKPTAAEAWVRERLEARAQEVEDRDQHMPDGSIMRIQHRRASNGGRVTVFSDITGLVRQAKELAAALSAAEAGMRTKSVFLANMSHELRTPMNGIIGAADLLAREELPPHQSELVRVARTSAGDLNQLLCDILDLAEIGAGSLSLASGEYDMRQVAHDLVASLEPRANDKGLSLTWRTSGEVPERLAGDGRRVRQLLENLLSNAVKFTEKGGVDLEIRRIDDRLRLSVSDTGVGMTPDMRDRVFNHFEQADGSLTRRQGGAGLGLAIVQELTTLMDGALSCESTLGLGSTFTVDLPLQIADQVTASGPQPETAEGVAAGASILVVDDNPTNRRVLGLLLEGVGIHAEFAEDGRAGVEAWKNSAPDAVLMDIQMPVMDGLTAIRAIRDLERAEARAPTPIIVVSANAMPEDMAASAAAGADGHVAKPVTPAALFSALEAVGPRECAQAAA